MIERQPELARWSAANGGMEPGLKNLLGARALYIFKDGKDTLYRLHGTIEARSIGKSVSSGCVRLLNQDVIDLFDRSTPNAAILVV
jgi:lipoprotein-anchoring transpeptidase ErfK/SrfK